MRILGVLHVCHNLLLSVPMSMPPASALFSRLSVYSCFTLQQIWSSQILNLESLQYPFLPFNLEPISKFFFFNLSIPTS